MGEPRLENKFAAHYPSPYLKEDQNGANAIP
jgi:hypothetical protein